MDRRHVPRINTYHASCRLCLAQPGTDFDDKENDLTLPRTKEPAESGRGNLEDA